jgi:curli production assembly/transport component CsgF
MVRRSIGSSLLATFALAVSAQAGELIYTPVNPSFGGSPLNGSQLLNNANAQNKYEKKEEKQSQAELFAKQLQSRLYSALAGQITDAIFGENAQESGTVQFDDQIIQWSQGLDSVIVTITNQSTGAVTVIEVPNSIDSIF